MLTEDQQLELERDIASWLDTSPPAEDILAYASELPDEDSSVLPSVIESYIRVLFQRKDAYFTAANCEEFVQDVPVPEQLQAMSNFLQYNAGSVLAKLAKTYPSVGQLVLPSDIRAWSEGFADKLEAALSLTTAREFSQARLYLHSLQSSHDAASLSAIQAKLHELFLKEGQAYDADQVPTHEEQEEWKAFYASLKFLPQDQVERLSQFEGFFERMEINHALINILTLLTHPEGITNFDEALWNIQKAQVLEDLVVVQESNRRAGSAEGQVTFELYNTLNQLWTEENILNGKTVEATRALIEQYKSKSLPVNLAEFFKDNLVFQAAISPLNATAVIDNILAAPSPAEAEVYVTQVASSEGYDMATRNLLKAFLHQITQLIRYNPAQATLAELNPVPAV